MTKLSAESRSKLSASLRAKWASGTRRKNSPETYAKVSATHKRLYLEGVMRPPVNTPEECRRYQAMANPENILRANRLVGDKKIGVPNPPGPSAKGPEHWKAVFWVLKTPDNATLSGPNLNEIIRQNAHLFDPSDLNWAKSRCRASKGIRGLTEEKGSYGRKKGVGPHTWKGWRVVSVAPRPESA